MDKDVASLLKEAVTEVLEEVRRVPTPSQGHQVVTLHHGNQPPAPTPPWHVWLCAGLTVVAGMVAAFALYMVKDARDDARTDRIEFNRKLDSLESSDNAIRAYINTGILKPRTEAKN